LRGPREAKLVAVTDIILGEGLARQGGTVRAASSALQTKETANNNCYDFGGRGLIV
jgi:hypothetical protein